MKENNNSSKSAQQQNFVIPIIVMFLLFFMIAFVTGFAGSMGVVVTNQFGASDTLSQLGTLATFIAYACMGIPAGLILKRKGYKFTSLTAVVVGFVGVAVQLMSGYVESFAVYVVGAFIAGFSLCMLNTVVNPMLNTLGGGGNRGNQLVQFGASCNSIGATLAPFILGLLIGGNIKDASVSAAAPAMYIAMAIFVVAFFVIWFTAIPEPHMETAEERTARLSGAAPKDAHSPLSFRHFLLGAIAIFFYVGVEVGIPNMSNLYMSKNELIGPAVAGTIVAVYWFLMMCGRLLGGVIGGKISAKAMLSKASLLAIVFILCLIFIPENVTYDFTRVVDGQETVVPIPIKMVFMFLTGLCTSVMWGAIFNLATEGLGKYTPMASGIFMTMVCGGGILPFVQGFVADKVGIINSYWIVILGFALILAYALVGSKNVNKDIPVE
ncbi:MAG: MFS transporter [Bacteroidales bacterium]|nr:MFS transporter [Bacteroidales bacterium]